MAWPPIWNPTLPPLVKINAGALQPVGVHRERQLCRQHLDQHLGAAGQLQGDEQTAIPDGAHYQYTVVQNKVILVDPTTMRVVDVIR